MKIFYLVLITSFLTIVLYSCSDEHRGVSASLKNELRRIEVSCEYLKTSKFSKGYWVRSELDGWGLLVISEANQPNTYVLGLMAHGHEMALETRMIECERL